MDSPTHGTLSLNADGSFSYAPALNFNGSDSFTYRANDEVADSNVATVTLTILPVNDIPMAANDAYVTNEDTPLTVATTTGLLANDTDVDGDVLSAALVSGPTHGSLTLESTGAFTYTPVANFSGLDGFTYKANDETADSNVASVSLTVTPVNDAPVAVDDAYSTNEDTVLTISAPGLLGNDTDVDGDALTAIMVSEPAYGALSVNADGSFTYSPAANFNGADAFTYKANDGTADSKVATVSLTITPVNDAPVAVNDTYTAVEDTPLTIAAPGLLANDTDVDGDALAAILVSEPAHGTLSLGLDGGLTYTPAANFNGADAFTYKANDGTEDSNLATVSLTVTPVNDAPAAANNSYTTTEDTPLIVPVQSGLLANDTDVDGDALTAVLANGPSHGTLSLNPDGAFTYSPAVNFNGADSFTYKATDGTADSNVATVAITITPVNDAPVASADAYATAEDTALTIPAPGLLTNDTDVDGDPLTAAMETGPAHGSLVLNPDGSFTYAPAANFIGADAFTYKATDGVADSNVAIVSLSIIPINHAPIATSDAYTTSEDTTLVVPVPGLLANDTDVDGDPLTAIMVDNSTHGSLTLNPDGSFTYAPAKDFYGSDSFTYKANDGTADSNVATVVLNVSPTNQAPVVDAGPDARVDEGTGFSQLGTFTDPDLTDTWTATVDYGDGSGAQPLALSGTTFQLTHTFADDGTYAVRVTVADESGDTGFDTVNLTVLNVAPQITVLVSSAPEVGDAKAGEKITLSGFFTDVGRLDTHTATIDWGDGTISQAVITEANGAGALGESHAYTSGGVYTVTATLTDDDGGADARSTSTVITGAGLHDGVLQIVGTRWNDWVMVEAEGRCHPDIAVEASFSPCHEQRFQADAVSRIVIVLGDGKDTAIIEEEIRTPALIDGGAGDDHLKAGGGPAVLLGGPGNDGLTGGEGRNVLIGGTGADHLVGGPTEDILIAGTTAYDADSAALFAILTEWGRSDRSYAQRVADLKSGVGHNGAVKLTEATVFGDGAKHTLSGGGGHDWVFSDGQDKVTYRCGSEMDSPGAMSPEDDHPSVSCSKPKPVIDWSGSYQDAREAEARSGACGVSGDQQQWIRDFVLDLAADKNILDPNADIQIVLPAEKELLLAGGLRG